MQLPDSHQQCVVFIEQRRVWGQIGHYQIPQLLMAGLSGREQMSGEHARSVGVHDESRLAGGIEHDAVGGFRADALDS